MDANERTARLAEDALLDRLGATLAVVDPAPPELRQISRELLAWRTFDAELAALLRTGAAQSTAPAD